MTYNIFNKRTVGQCTPDRRIKHQLKIAPYFTRAGALFFVNNIENQKGFEKLCRYKGRFLHIYNFAGSKDSMAALHAKVISVDEQQTLITSANLSYHGQEGNIELGTLVDSKKIARQVDDVFTHLIFNKIVQEI